MKITIEPTKYVEDFVTVSVSEPTDDGSVEDVVELLRAALLAWGYAESSIDAVLRKQ